MKAAAITLVVLSCGCGVNEPLRWEHTPVRVCNAGRVDWRALRSFNSAINEIESDTCDLFDRVRRCDGHDAIELVSRPFCHSGQAHMTWGRYIHHANARIPDLTCYEDELGMMMLAKHELLHAIGLDHSKDRDSIMDPQLGNYVMTPQDMYEVERRYCHGR